VSRECDLQLQHKSSTDRQYTPALLYLSDCHAIQTTYTVTRLALEYKRHYQGSDTQYHSNQDAVWNKCRHIIGRGVGSRSCCQGGIRN
jgi:hypothetical protein